MVIKEHAHKCNPYFDLISIPDFKSESTLDQDSLFQVARRGGDEMLKVHAAVEVQLAAYTCSIVSLGYLKLSNFDLTFRDLWFYFQGSMILIGSK